jgi:hypothetical protein
MATKARLYLATISTYFRRRRLRRQAYHAALAHLDALHPGKLDILERKANERSLR